MKKNKLYDSNFGMVYSTGASLGYDNDNDTLLPQEQTLHLHIEKKGRGGKWVTIVRNFRGRNDKLKELGKMLKNKCGVGGSTKDGEIIIQGQVRDKITKILEEQGYKTKRIGG